MVASGIAKQKTMEESLTSMLGDLGQALGAPDADQQFLLGLQQAITSYIQQKRQQQQQMIAGAATLGGQPQGGQPGQQQQPGAQGGLPPQMQAAMQAAGAGGGGQPPPPNQVGPGGGAGPAGLSTMTDPDELRRMLAGSPVG